MNYELHHGDCLDILRSMPDNSVDAVVTDPPYGLSFMGKRWDYDVPSEDVWAECLRVLKPGGHLLAFAGTRTQHRMAVRIEDAGFEIRDMIAWVYGSGFPKSMDVSKTIDKAAGAEREVVGLKRYGDGQTYHGGEAAARTGGGIMGEAATRGPSVETAPATDAAKKWHGWGTALKPALEPITVARKSLIGTVAENVLTWGTGGLNVDGCRVAVDPNADASQLRTMSRGRRTADTSGQIWGLSKNNGDVPQVVRPEGRWPANLIHDGSEEATELLGDAQRFFYCAKASKRDRDEGCEAMEAKLKLTQMRGSNGTGDKNFVGGFNDTVRRNHHPTVKPTDLMRYLCRLVTPPDGTVLDPFMGSGSTGKAAMIEGFNFIGIEREAEYLDIARARIEHVAQKAGDKPLTLGL